MIEKQHQHQHQQQQQQQTNKQTNKQTVIDKQEKQKKSVLTIFFMHYNYYYGIIEVLKYYNIIKILN